MLWDCRCIMPLVKDLTKYTTAKDTEILVNYDYSDILSGDSIINFYGYMTEDSTGKDPHANRQVFTTADNTFQAVGDLDIDTPPFVKEQEVQGEMTIQMAYGGLNMAGADNVIPIIKVYHYDGSTETQIGTVTGPTLSGINPGTDVDRSTTMVCDITPTTFAIGDLVRINITSGGNNTLRVYLDPTNTATPYTGALFTNFIFSVPFEVDL